MSWTNITTCCRSPPARFPWRHSTASSCSLLPLPPKLLLLPLLLLNLRNMSRAQKVKQLFYFHSGFETKKLIKITKEQRKLLPILPSWWKSSTKLISIGFCPFLKVEQPKDHGTGSNWQANLTANVRKSNFVLNQSLKIDHFVSSSKFISKYSCSTKSKWFCSNCPWYLA